MKVHRWLWSGKPHTDTAEAGAHRDDRSRRQLQRRAGPHRIPLDESEKTDRPHTNHPRVLLQKRIRQISVQIDGYTPKERASRRQCAKKSAPTIVWKKRQEPPHGKRTRNGPSQQLAATLRSNTHPIYPGRKKSMQGVHSKKSCTRRKMIVPITNKRREEKRKRETTIKKRNKSEPAKSKPGRTGGKRKKQKP